MRPEDHRKQAEHYRQRAQDPTFEGFVSSMLNMAAEEHEEEAQRLSEALRTEVSIPISQS